MSVRLNEIDNQFIIARWKEVIEHTIVINDAEWNEIDDGFLTLFLDEDDANLWGIYPVLSIDPGGRVAEFIVNMPYHFMTFGQLLTAAAARTASS